MTKIYSTGKSPDVKAITCDSVTHDKQVDKNLQDYQNEIISLVDQGIGGVDIARGLLVQGENTDVLPRYYHDGLAGALAHLVKARELMEKVFGLHLSR